MFSETFTKAQDEKLVRMSDASSNEETTSDKENEEAECVIQKVIQAVVTPIEKQLWSDRTLDLAHTTKRQREDRIHCRKQGTEVWSVRMGLSLLEKARKTPQEAEGEGIRTRKITLCNLHYQMKILIKIKMYNRSVFLILQWLIVFFH